MDIHQLEQLFHKKERSKEEQLFVYDQLQQIKFFKEYAAKGKLDEINKIIQHCKYRKFQKDHCLLELDIKSEYFFIILSGQVGFYIPKPKKGKEENKQQRQFSKMEKQRDNLFLVKLFKKGDSFGEISLIYDRGSDGSMFAMEETTCLLLHKQNFLQIVGDQEKNSITKEIEFLQHHPLFENWSFNLLRLLYFFSQVMNYNKNEVVYLEDTKPTHIYIIKQGEFAIYRNFKDQSKKVDKKKESDEDEDNKSDEEVNIKGDYKNEANNDLKRKFEKQKKYKLAVIGKGEIFGEEDILMKQNRTFSVVCDSYNGAQLIMIKSKVFKLSVMADIGSATFIKQRLKQKNYNHQLRLESINTFIKEYKGFFADPNDKKQNEQQNLNNFQPSNQSSQTKQETQSKTQKRNSQDMTNGQNIYQNQGFLSPPSTLTLEKGNSLNFSNSYQNERKRSFNSSTQQIDNSENLQNHQDLFDHFSQFQKKIYKTEKNKISSNHTNSAYKEGSPIRDSLQSSQRSSILQIKFPNQQNTPKMPLTQDNSPEQNFFGNSNKDVAYRLSINSLVTPKNFSNHKRNMDQQNMQLNNIEELAQNQQQKPTHLLFEGTKQSSRDFLNSSCFSSQYDKGIKIQKSMSQQFLVPPQDGNMLSKERRVSNFYTESLVNQSNRIIKKSSSSQRDSQSVDSKNSANQNQSQINQNQRSPTSQDQIFFNGNSPNQQQEYYSVSKQPNQQLQCQMLNQPNSFYNLKGQLQKQDYLLNTKNPNDQYSEQIELQEQNQFENKIRNSDNFQYKKVRQLSSKFVLQDSTTFSPSKYPLNYKMSSSTTDAFQSELTNLQINQQAQQQFQFSNSFNNANNADAKKNGKKIHLQFLLNKQKPQLQQENTIYYSISAIMPSISAQSCAQICSFPKENLEFNHSMSTNVNNYFPSSQKIQKVSNQQSVFTDNYLSVQSQPQLQEDYFQQENKILLIEKERGGQDEKKEKARKKQKQFRNSIFTDTFQKTFQQNLHHIQYRILQKKHKLKDIQQSIAKHIQDQTIKHFLEENTLVKSKYGHIRSKYQQQQQQQQQQIQPSKSETKFEALKQMLKNNLHYSTQEIEQGLTQMQSFARQKTASNYQKKAEFQYEEDLNQQNETYKHSPNIKTQHEKSRSSFNSNFQNNLKSQQQHPQQQQYKFQQMHKTTPKQNLVIDIQQQDDQEMKNFSITPNDKTGTVHIKSLQSLSSISKKGQSNVFSFTKIPLNNEIKSVESLRIQSGKQLCTENHTKKLSLIEQNFNSLTNFNTQKNIKIKNNIQFNYKIPQKTSNS
ncbi:hypothetical protein ABPG72_004656 [Tetrahymena utriculariae]